MTEAVLLLPLLGNGALDLRSRTVYPVLFLPALLWRAAEGRWDLLALALGLWSASALVLALSRGRMGWGDVWALGYLPLVEPGLVLPAAGLAALFSLGYSLASGQRMGPYVAFLAAGAALAFGIREGFRYLL
jgi:hypothetical protein